MYCSSASPKEGARRRTLTAMKPYGVVKRGPMLIRRRARYSTPLKLCIRPISQLTLPFYKLVTMLWFCSLSGFHTWKNMRRSEHSVGEWNGETKLASDWNLTRWMNGVASIISRPTLHHESLELRWQNLQKVDLWKIYSQARSSCNNATKFLDHSRNKESENVTIPNDLEAINDEFTI